MTLGDLNETQYARDTSGKSEKRLADCNDRHELVNATRGCK